MPATPRVVLVRQSWTAGASCAGQQAVRVVIDRGRAEARRVRRIDCLVLEPGLVDQEDEQAVGDLAAVCFPRVRERRRGDAVTTQLGKIMLQQLALASTSIRDVERADEVIRHLELPGPARDLRIEESRGPVCFLVQIA